MRAIGLLNLQMQLLFVCLITLINQDLHAANIKLESCDEKNLNCIFSLEGPIQRGDGSKFIRAILEKLPVTTFLDLNSDGGDLLEAIEFAKTLQVLNIITVVSPRNRCNSACVVLLAAGASRIPSGKIGIHRPYNVANLTQREAKAMFDNAKKEVLPILEVSGISSLLWDLIVSTPSESVKFLTKTEKIELGLEGSSPAYGEYTDGLLVKRYSISKAELFVRKNKINEYCVRNFDGSDFEECMESVYKTGTPYK